MAFRADVPLRNYSLTSSKQSATTEIVKNNYSRKSNVMTGSRHRWIANSDYNIGERDRCVAIGTSPSQSTCNIH